MKLRGPFFMPWPVVLSSAVLVACVIHFVRMRNTKNQIVSNSHWHHMAMLYFHIVKTPKNPVV